MTLPVRRPGLALARLLAQHGRPAEARAIITAALGRVPSEQTTLRSCLMREHQLLTEQEVPHPPVPTGSAQLAQALASLADERGGPMAAARTVVEHTARHAARQSSAVETELAHRLELLARRIYGVQQDLTCAADTLAAAPHPAAGPEPGPR